MPRSNWKGVISFGLVNIPISLVPSENKTSHISFHQIDKRNNARIKYQRVNAETGKAVAWEDIIKGYEYEKDQVVPVPEDVWKRVAGDQGRAIDIETFIDKKELDPITIENAYYIVPDKKGIKGYVLLREVLANSNKIGIAQVIISTKEYLTAVMPHGDGLVLCLLKYANEMRKEEEFDLPGDALAKYKISKKELEIANQLIKAMSSKWKPEKYKDQYQAAVHKWIEETVNNLPHKTKKKKAVPLTAKGANFVDLLKKSLQSSKGSAKTKKAPAHVASKAKAKAKSGRTARQLH